MFATSCNRPRLKDVKAAQRIIDRYCFDWDLEIVIEEDHLNLTGCGWVAAWKVPLGVDPDDFRPAYEDSAIEAFEDLLKDLASCLAEPLTVQSVGTVDGHFPLSACEWHVQPGSGNVETSGFNHCDAEPQASQSRRACVA